MNLELADTYFVFDDDAEDEVAVGFAQEGDDVGPFEEDATTKALVTATRAAVAARVPRRRRPVPAPSPPASRPTPTVWLMHPRQAGRSFAVPVEDSALRGRQPGRLLPAGIVVPRAADRARPGRPGDGRPRTAAPVRRDRQVRPVAPRLRPAVGLVARVMRLSETRLSRLRIDPFTAAEIGWGPADRQTTTAGVDPRVDAGRRIGRGVVAWTEGRPPRRRGRPGQFDSTDGRFLASWFTRCAASEARRASEYLARGAEQVSSL